MSNTRLTVHAPGRAMAVRFSSTVSDLKMLRSCGDQPMPAWTRRSGRSRVMSRPPSLMLPDRCVVRPSSELISVVLPVPLRPSSASDCPSASVKEMSDSTSASP